MRQYTHFATYNLGFVPAHQLEDMEGIMQSLGIDATSDGHYLKAQSYSSHSLVELQRLTGAKIVKQTKIENEMPCVFLGREDTTIPAFLLCLPMFDNITFSATNDGLYAYADRAELKRVFGGLRIIDSTQKADAEI